MVFSPNCDVSKLIELGFKTVPLEVVVILVVLPSTVTAILLKWSVSKSSVTFTPCNGLNVSPLYTSVFSTPSNTGASLYTASTPSGVNLNIACFILSISSTPLL